MSNPFFQKLLDQFNEHALRPLLQSTKEKLDQAIDSAPTSLLISQLEEAFEQLKNPAATLANQLDASQFESLANALKTQLQNPTVSLVVAHGLKELVRRKSADLGALGALINLENTSADEIAAQLRTLATSLPSGFLAEQIVAVLKSVPQALPQQPMPDLPAPDAIADAALDILRTASSALGNAASGASLNDTLNALKKLPADVNTIFSRLAGKQSNQNQPPAAEKPVTKRQPRGKKGKGFGGDF